jgi:circadian clock protein KaiC
LSYLSDAIFLFRYFEAEGRLHKVVSAVKSRVTPHESSIRQFGIGPQGIQVGEPLKDFEGVLTGAPAYRGSTPLMESHPAVAAS